jgi:ankyrin repeat protein
MDIASALILMGADVNIQSEKYGNALQAALLKGHKEIVHFLFDQSVDVNV